MGLRGLQLSPGHSGVAVTGDPGVESDVEPDPQVGVVGDGVGFSSRQGERVRDSVQVVDPDMTLGGDHHNIGGEQVPVPVDEAVHVRGADLIFALDEELQAHRYRTVECTNRCGVEDHPGLVVRCPTAAQATIAFGRLERRRVPLLGRTGCLDVMVCIQQHGRCSRRAIHLAAYRRMCRLDLEETNPGHT